MRRAADCPSRMELESLRLGKLSSDMVEQLAQHLEQCDSCVQVFQKLNGDDVLVELLQSACRGRSEPREAHSQLEGRGLQCGVG